MRTGSRFCAGVIVALATAGAAVGRSPVYPLPEAPLRVLPPLDSSDAALRVALRRVEGGEALLALLSNDAIVRWFVAMIHGAARPLADVGAAHPDPATGAAARQEVWVRALEGVAPEGLVAVYVRLYPLFQDAYRTHIGEGGHFNDALVGAIDQILSEPAAGAGPDTPGRRWMLRFDAAQAWRVKRVLRVLRGLLALQAPGSG